MKSELLESIVGFTLEELEMSAIRNFQKCKFLIKVGHNHWILMEWGPK